MSTTPLWVPLVAAGMGSVGALAGVVVTLRRGDRREQQAWEREREREKEHWGREDSARTFEHRREAYADFYNSVKVLARKAADISIGSGDSLEEGWFDEALEKLHRLEFYADHELCLAARKTYQAACNWCIKAEHGEPDDVSIYDFQRRYERDETIMLRQMRERLSIPEREERPALDFLKSADRPVAESD